MNDQLLKSEYCRVVFDLEFQERFTLSREMVLRLRRELVRIARLLPVERGLRSATLALLDPVIPLDPYARRLYQKPAPPFVVVPPARESVSLDCGDSLQLEVLFFAEAAEATSLFANLLRHLGQIGFCRGEGRFELIDLNALDLSGGLTRLPLPDVLQPATGLIWLPLQWSVEALGQLSSPCLSFETPARLLSGGKPLFAPDFAALFPFVLRRVSSHLYSCYGFDLTGDPQGLIDEARRTSVDVNGLFWHDWRCLADGKNDQELGGVAGEVVFKSAPSEPILTVLALGSLFHIGKNAAYGCGRYRLTERAD